MTTITGFLIIMWINQASYVKTDERYVFNDPETCAEEAGKLQGLATHGQIRYACIPVYDFRSQGHY